VGCKHSTRWPVAGQDMWQCQRCGVMGREDEILYTPYCEVGPMPTRWDLEDEIGRLRAIIDSYEKDKK